MIDRDSECLYCLEIWNYFDERSSYFYESPEELISGFLTKVDFSRLNDTPQIKFSYFEKEKKKDDR